MTAPGHDLLVSVARGDLSLALSALQAADNCLRQLDLTLPDRTRLIAQVIEMNRLSDRISLWVSAGTSDFDDELTRLDL